MSGTVNKQIIVGYLGDAPEMRRNQAGKPIAHLSVATTKTWRDQATGERKQKTQWHRVVIFSEPLCKVAEQYLKKGSKVYLEGESWMRKWTDQQGIERFTTEVVLGAFGAVLVLLDRRERAPGAQGAEDYGDDESAETSATDRSPAPPRRDLDDEIPF